MIILAINIIFNSDKIFDQSTLLVLLELALKILFQHPSMTSEYLFFTDLHSRFWPLWPQTGNCQLWPFWQLHIETLDSEPRQGPVWQLPVWGQSGNCQSWSEWHDTLAFATLATAGNCHWGPGWLPHGYLWLFITFLFFIQKWED